MASASFFSSIIDHREPALEETGWHYTSDFPTCFYASIIQRKSWGLTTPCYCTDKGTCRKEGVSKG